MEAAADYRSAESRSNLGSRRARGPVSPRTEVADAAESPARATGESMRFVFVLDWEDCSRGGRGGLGFD